MFTKCIMRVFELPIYEGQPTDLFSLLKARSRRRRWRPMSKRPRTPCGILILGTRS